MKGKTMKRWKAVALIIVGIIVCLVGLLLGTRFLPTMLLTTVKEKSCINSKDHDSYNRWTGSLFYYQSSIQIRVRYWNITNRDGFLYNGETPIVKEVGPYVYIVATMKKDVIFSADEVSYQELTSTKYDPATTKLLCPVCNETDKITIPNAAYVQFALQAGGDRQMGAMFIPSAVHFLLSAANRTGSAINHTLEQFGNFSSTLFSTALHGAPTGWYPAGFAPWFSKQNSTPTSPLYGILKNVSRNGYNLTEMMAINSVITTPLLLGTTGNKTVLEQCKANPTLSGCGYLFYLQAYETRRQAVPSNDTILLHILRNINELFCQSPSFCVQLDKATFSALSAYITNHLMKLAIHLAIDRIDFGPLMTRTVKQLSHGYNETELKVPVKYPSGLPVIGFLPTDSIKSVKPTVKYYTCKHATKALQIKEYNRNSVVSSAIYPNANMNLRTIGGFDRMFGFKTAASCKTAQSSPRDSYVRFDTTLLLKYSIHRKGDEKIESVYTSVFEADKENLFKKNNMTVFRDGLIDLSRSKSGLPLIASMPHFLYGDAALARLFNTKPDVSAHNTFLSIEPISGSALKILDRIQMNLAIPEQTISAPRQRPLNITYKEKTSSTHYSQAIPLFWTELYAVASSKQLESFDMAYKVIDGACVCIVITALFGGSFIIAGIIFLVKSVKTPVHNILDGN